METTTQSTDQDAVSLHAQLLKECEAMAKYALASGMTVPPFVLEMVSGHDAGCAASSARSVRKLTQAHTQLVHLVAPATPRTILFLDAETSRKGLGRILGSVTLVRRIMVAGLIFLFTFIGLSLTSYVNANPESGNLFKSEGVPLLIVQLFYLSAAGIGATFAALFEANRYVTKYTFDPRYRFSYWIKIGLGIIAGFILAQLIPIENQGGTMEIPLGKPTLAMLGGFSATLVYRILNRLVETLESLFQGETKTLIETQERLARTRATQEIAQSRLTMAARLLTLQEQLGTGVDKEALQQQVNQLIENLMPLDVEPAPEPTPALPEPRDPPPLAPSNGA